MTKFSRSANGKYVVKGSNYEILIGTRAQVWHGTAFKTSGGLTKTALFKNSAGRIVSKAKHFSAKKENRLVKAGYGTKKGKFGFVKLNKRKSSSKSKKGGAHQGNHNHGHNHGSHHASHGNHTRGHRGGSPSALNPSNYNGAGVKTSGVNVQFAAGNATS
jgi:hypothetical protein